MSPIRRTGVSWRSSFDRQFECLQRAVGGSIFVSMSAISATLQIEDDASKIVAEMLRQFPKGARVKLDICEVPMPDPVPGLEEYRRIIAQARENSPRGPWRATEEAMRALREGEEG